jgi:hypothetical protein
MVHAMSNHGGDVCKLLETDAITTKNSVVDPLPSRIPNLEDARRFLHALDPAGIFTFQTFLDADVFRDADIGIQSAAERPRVLHGSLDDHAEKLTALNDQGAGIFVMVNAGDGVIKPGAKTCRTAANVQRVRAVFVDLDGAPIAPVLESALPPDWVVRSSPGRWHAYWRVDDCPLERFESMQTALAVKFDGDTTVKDLPRVMRIPGFLHQKAEPFRSELWEPARYREVMEMSHE